MSWLREHCPRLALARDQRVAEIARETVAQRRWRRERQEALKVEAHRDLQLVRAWATGNPKYIRHRERKLAAIRATLRRLEQERPGT
jgi:hypothetical protein